ncbi:MAG: GNAT family N-acetyltransferase [Cryomorphaceae bacterium]|nr:GNAT family N-acetyltransferase [Cryomorphaceae bacterium]
MQKNDKKYIFESARLGFRTWNETDLDELSRMNADVDVMRFFPSVQTREQSRLFLERMQQHQDEFGFCYFAVEELISRKFIGFIGACQQTYEAPFTPCTDVGWRLLPAFWGKGYAQEGALGTMDFLKRAGVDEVFAVAPEVNLPSIRVMERAGMKRQAVFKHPHLNDSPLATCVYWSKSL